MKTGKKPPPRILIKCPSCGYEQKEYSEAKTSMCRACGTYIRIEAPVRERKTGMGMNRRRDIRCFQCGHEEAIPTHMLTWQCTNCSAKVDLGDHNIDKGCGMNIFTYGSVILGQKGHFTGARAEAEWIRLQGGLSVGVMVARDKVIVEGRVRFRANLKGSHLEVRPGALLEAWQMLDFKTANIQGKVVAKQLKVTEELTVTSLGNLEAGSFQFNAVHVEPGGILRGTGTSLKYVQSDFLSGS